MIKNIQNIKCPLGYLHAALQDNEVISIRLTKKPLKSDPQREYNVKGSFIRQQLQEYFSGQRKQFDLNLLLKGTDFQKKVWQQMQKIPYGKTVTYGEIAKQIGRPNAARAVGGACNKNPVLLAVPCHRVVGAGGSLGGFALGLQKKRQLLALEKSKIVNDLSSKKRAVFTIEHE